MAVDEEASKYCQAAVFGGLLVYVVVQIGTFTETAIWSVSYTLPSAYVTFTLKVESLLSVLLTSRIEHTAEPSSQPAGAPNLAG